jgi:CRISPR-associated protein Cmr2
MNVEGSAHEQPDAADRSDRALIVSDVDRVHSYVFESAKLTEMRGGSLVLDLLNAKNSDGDSWGDVKIEQKEIKGIPQLLDEMGLPQDKHLIYGAGGGALIEAPLSRAQQIAEAIELSYANTTLTATTTTAVEAFVRFDTTAFRSKVQGAKGEAWRLIKHSLVPEDEWEQCSNPSLVEDRHLKRINDVGHLYNSLGYRLRRAKQGKTSAPVFEVSPFTERCSYCRFRPSVALAPEIDERPICRACLRKRQDIDDRSARSFHLRRFWDYLQASAHDKHVPRYLERFTDKTKWLEVESPPDLEAIAKASKTDNFVGIIYADGNDMGGRLDRIANAESFKAFAKEVRLVIEQSVFSALGELLDRHQVGHCHRLHGGKRCNRDHVYHPFEIISIGGDDVYLFVPSDVALAIAGHICERFEEKCRQSKNSTVNGLTLSAGVLIAHVTTPVYFSRNVVKGLLKSAKQLSKRTLPAKSAIDYQVVNADTAISEDIDAFRAQAYSNRFPNEVLTARPLTTGQLKKLIDTVRRLKTLSFSKSQLYALREAVVHGPQARATNYYYYQKARSSEHNREGYEALHELLTGGNDSGEYTPFHRRQATVEMVTSLVDLIEVYDFVRLEKSHREDRL